MVRFVIFFLFIFILAGCLPSPYFQKTNTIPGYLWFYNYKPSFSFEIADTNYTYQSYFIIRHTQAYPYCNIWLLVDIKAPGDTAIKKERVNITLSEPNGKWMGRGIGEIYEQRLLLKFNDSITFHKKGVYQIWLEQNMRINPLPEIMDVGLRVEKTNIPYKKKLINNK